MYSHFEDGKTVDIKPMQYSIPLSKVTGNQI